MNAGTWVPYSSNVPLREGSGGLLPLVSAKVIHLQRTWLSCAGPGPMLGAWGGHWSHWGHGWRFSRGLLLYSECEQKIKWRHVECT